MKSNRVRLFIKPYCGWCRQAIAWLDQRGIAYEKLDVMADRAAWDEMEQLSGQTLAPVIQVDGRVLADFGAEELEEFWKTIDRPLMHASNESSPAPTP
jgi:glutaredoxin 3